MEAFSLLRYWRNGGGNAVPVPTSVSLVGNVFPLSAKNTTTIANSLLRPSTSSSSSSVDGFEDEGPFFDLEFAVPDDEEEDETGTPNGNAEDEAEAEEVEGEDAGVSASSPSDCTTPGKQHQVHHRKHSHRQNHQFLAGSSLFKSANKLRVFTLKSSRKTKSIDPSLVTAISPSPKQVQQLGSGSNKFFAVKFKADEVPIVSLFTRDGSSRNSGGGSKQNREDANVEGGKTSKEVVNRYLNKIKPLYVRVSRRSYGGEKSKFPGVLGSVPENSADTSVAKEEVEKKVTVGGDLQNRVRKRLGKIKSASSTVASVPSPPSTVTSVISRRRDDSLLQQQDGIQSAIAHCKRSFNASRDDVVENPKTTSD
ncbi:hypothetical protein ZOSMA_78G00160 [Zostera marina]|uniref:Membrane-associated kinase regulator 2 n=1 Tax=Zostera marina TaxID=29655 RepID=A0A0K9NQK8_ZOSMR|nr:hypothetical protein ZOSMA_78G00160 [Zostera marina]